MQLKNLLDEIISKEVYKPVKVGYKLHYQPSELPPDLVEKIETDNRFRTWYKEKVSKLLRDLGHENLEIVNIDPVSHSVEVRYTAYYLGSREFPEIHLKTLLIFYNEMGVDICDPAIFDEIVEKARRDLGEKKRKEKEARLDRFATLFKGALEQETRTK